MRNHLSFALLAFSAVFLPTLPAQTISPKEKPMKHYALLFHSTRALTPEELKQRAVEIASWVKQVTDMGITLDPRSFGEATTLSMEGNEVVSRAGASDPTLRQAVFFDPG